MPRQIASVFKPLKQELWNIRVRWSLFRQLFVTGEERVNLLNRFAPGFFGNVQLAMSDDTVLAICRFTDPAASGGRGKRNGRKRRASYTLAALAARLQAKKQPNATLERLVGVVAVDLGRRIASAGKKADRERLKTFGKDLGRRLRVIDRLRKKHFEKRRNKRIGHNDLCTVRALWSGQPTPAIPSPEQFEEILEHLAGLMNAVQAHYEAGDTTYYGPEHTCLGDGNRLVAFLRDLAERQDADKAAGRGPWPRPS
jgi:hypothetical protein